MANANIFAQYLQAPQSVTSKIAALDQADFQRAQMEGAVRQNRLQELAFQRGEQERAAAQAEASLLQRLAAESGGDETKYAEGLRKVGKFTQAGEIEKARGARLKENTETLDKRLGIYKSAADNIQDRNQALGWLQAQFNDPIVGPLIQSRGTFEDLARNIPDNATDPQKFAQWRVATSQGMSKVQEMYAPKPTTIDLGGRKVVIDQNPNSPTFGKELQGFQVSNAATDLLIPGPDGRMVPNQPLINAKTGIAKAGATVTMGSPVAGVDPATGQPVFFQPSNRPGVQPQIIKGVAPTPKPAESEKPLTEAQAKATAFLGQMRAASKAIEELMPDQSNMVQQADVMLAGSAGNVMSSPKAQQVKQAQNQWSESFLRFKTGAAATADEVGLNNKTFFPQFGDSKEVIRQKQLMRQQAERDMEIVAAQGAQRVDVVGGSGTGKAPAAAKPAALPKAGDVIDGYRYKGGNPADKANWEKM